MKKKIEETETKMSALLKTGPMEGHQIIEYLHVDPFYPWYISSGSSKFLSLSVAKRYLRLDKEIEEVGRLSPSIRREFLTYTVIGLKKHREEVEKKSLVLLKKIQDISHRKWKLAKKIVKEICSQINNGKELTSKCCFLLCGDIIYLMAHDVPRPERSTGRMVRGSDIDIVVIVPDKYGEELIDKIDKAFFRMKQFYLINPSFREEIDYIVKDLSKVKEQLSFDTFQHQVACKLLWEGELLYGDQELWEEISCMMKKNKISKKLKEFEIKAIKFREKVEKKLLSDPDAIYKDHFRRLFYTKEEADEIF